MTPLQLRPSTLDEIVFEGRNKAYGAFDLRRSYPEHLRRAMAIAVSLFALMVATPVIVDYLKPDAITLPPTVIDDTTGTVLTRVDPLPAIKQPKPAVATPPPAAHRPPTFAQPTHVVPDHLVTQPETTVDPPANAIPGQVNSPGDSNAISHDGATGPATVAPPVTTPGDGIEKTPDVFIHVENMPEFVGGQQELMKYLRRNMHYPAMALRNQVEGKVFVAFTVSATGDIVDVEVIKGLGSGTDEEALRVIKKMPAWKPGVQNGRAVAVRYTLPITFSYSN